MERGSIIDAQIEYQEQIQKILIAKIKNPINLAYMLLASEKYAIQVKPIHRYK